MSEGSNGDKPVRILIVEDETIVALDLKNSLKVLGYDVVGTASSGEEAIAKADQTRPDLVLMDIILKGRMDGVQAAEVNPCDAQYPRDLSDRLRRRKDPPESEDNRTVRLPAETFRGTGVPRPHRNRALQAPHGEEAARERGAIFSGHPGCQRRAVGLEPGEQGDLSSRLAGNRCSDTRTTRSGSRPEDWFKRMHPADRVGSRSRLAQHMTGRAAISKASTGSWMQAEHIAGCSAADWRCATGTGRRIESPGPRPTSPTARSTIRSQACPIAFS